MFTYLESTSLLMSGALTGILKDLKYSDLAVNLFSK